jgi:uncharacterized protein
MQELSPNLQSRYQSIDFLRGIAVLGILLMNIPSFSFPSGQYHHFTDYTGINYRSEIFVTVFFEGTMRGLFSMLFGASCLLILSKDDDIKSIDIYYRRLLWMFLLGLLNFFILLWSGDILYSYALCGLFLFPFRKMKPKYLIMIGLVLSFWLFGRSAYRFTNERKPKYEAYKTAMADSVKLHKKLTKNQHEDIAKFKEMCLRFKKDTAKINSEIRQMRGNYKSVFDKRWQEADEYQKWTLYDMNFTDYMLMMFIGMGFFKLGVFTNKLNSRQYGFMVLIGYGIGLFLRIRFVNSFFYNQQEYENFFETYSIPTGAYSDIQRVMMTVGHIGLLMLVYRSGAFNWLVKILSKAGQMALSNYLLQSILCGLFFYGFGFGMFAKLQIYQNYLFVICVWIICLIFSNIWLHYFKFGPAEWLWRSLTYWKKQEMKR